jgi:starch synthase
VSVGTVGLRKGHPHLVEAFRILGTAHASLTLVGAITPGWHERLLLSQDGIRVTGAVSRERVVRELNRASIFVLASVEDGFGLVIAQAMATGLPVIATSATGVRELVTDGVEGIVVAPSDAQALANAIESLLTDPERGRAMGAAGRRKVESLGGWARYGRQVVQAFREARSGPS